MMVHSEYLLNRVCPTLRFFIIESYFLSTSLITCSLSFFLKLFSLCSKTKMEQGIDIIVNELQQLAPVCAESESKRFLDIVNKTEPLLNLV